ncbi:hypothetical protein GCM10011321_21070 [Youhaiella tibetensis]|uniref:DUF1491 family protein n=1 Tax=Paradevosia tibetensis TaxID=1447062 RepID=A0A5B9DLU1_9HYPH|nr:DUF1491 family protein [Youhaiella tibetensis]QEE19835.1 DUF1491 family protein [Youhaiella tibetensis]GGF29531.1 hypothetical protein GCM10011321_21070 [Youhaiella tibetensis]
MSQLRTDLWCAAFIRRHNNIGQFCVVSRRGDPVAGQVFIEVDHLNGTVSLFAPASAVARTEDEGSADRLFSLRFDHVEPAKVRERLAREEDFDPDFWVLSVETRESDLGLDIAPGA